MMYDLLAERTRNDSARVTNRLIDDLSLATKKSEELLKVLLRSTDKDHAEEKIHNASSLAKAFSFSKLLINSLRMDKSDYSSLARVKLAFNKHNNWVEFLCEFSFYFIIPNDKTEQDPLDSMSTNQFESNRFSIQDMFGISSMDNVGTIIKGVITLDNPEAITIQEAYDALKSVEIQISDQVLIELSKPSTVRS